MVQTRELTARHNPLSRQPRPKASRARTRVCVSQARTPYSAAINPCRNPLCAMPVHASRLKTLCASAEGRLAGKERAMASASACMVRCWGERLKSILRHRPLDTVGISRTRDGWAENRVGVELIGGNAFHLKVGAELQLVGVLEKKQRRNIVGESVSRGIEYGQLVSLRLGQGGISQQGGDVLANFLGPQLLALAFDERLLAEVGADVGAPQKLDGQFEFIREVAADGVNVKAGTIGEVPEKGAASRVFRGAGANQVRGFQQVGELAKVHGLDGNRKKARALAQALRRIWIPVMGNDPGDGQEARKGMTLGDGLGAAANEAQNQAVPLRSEKLRGEGRHCPGAQGGG